MKPGRYSPAHDNPDLAELVCSNSLKSQGLGQASGVLQEELRRLGSLLLEVADDTRVAAGQALAVDRNAFARRVTARLEECPRVGVVRREVTELSRQGHTIIATGPLTSESSGGRWSSTIGAGKPSSSA